MAWGRNRGRPTERWLDDTEIAKPGPETQMTEKFGRSEGRSIPSKNDDDKNGNTEFNKKEVFKSSQIFQWNRMIFCLTHIFCFTTSLY